MLERVTFQMFSPRLVWKVLDVYMISIRMDDPLSLLQELLQVGNILLGEILMNSTPCFGAA